MISLTEAFRQERLRTVVRDTTRCLFQTVTNDQTQLIDAIHVYCWSNADRCFHCVTLVHDGWAVVCHSHTAIPFDDYVNLQRIQVQQCDVVTKQDLLESVQQIAARMTQIQRHLM